MLGIYPAVSFPSAFKVLQALWSELSKGVLALQILTTLRTILMGLAFGLMLAFLLVYLWRKKGFWEDLVQTLVSIAHPLPGVALLPLLILWFGVGERVIVVMIVHSVLWPLAINLKAGIDAIPTIYGQIADVFSLSKKTRFMEIALPSSLPYLLSGLKTAWARAWRAMIAGEMIFGVIGQHGGLGTYLYQKRVFMDTPALLAGLLVITLLGILVEDVFFVWIEKRTVGKWGMSK
ncbi:ABC transporter permease subunit [Clostridia bacterium]|nr:ABC transporter permease subunit [Clostridia bacterium]